MDFDVNGVAQTVAVGAVVVAGFEVILHTVSGRTIYRAFKLKASDEDADPSLGAHLHPWGVNALVVACAVIAGLVCEGVSKGWMVKYRTDAPAGIVTVAKHLFLPSEDDLRIEKLFAPVEGEPHVWEATWLAEELLANHAFDGTSSAYATSVAAAMRHPLPSDRPAAGALRGSPALRFKVSDDTAVHRAALGLFYLGHNRLYTSGQSLHELDGIEQRITFGRSLAAASVVLLGLLIFLTTARWIMKKRVPWKPIAVLALLCATAYGCARLVFYYEHDAYDIRVYGYLSTLLKTENAAPAPQPHP